MPRMPKAKKRASATKSSSTRVNKSAWIREQPLTMPAKQVVAKAKAQGITLSLAQVYTTRSSAKKMGKGKVGRVASPAPAAKLKGQASGDLRRQFVSIATRIGTDEAQRLLDRIIDVETR
jgi:hypothetical protein